MRQAVILVVAVSLLKALARVQRLHLINVVLLVRAQFILVPVGDDIGRTVRVTAAVGVARSRDFVA